MIFFFVEAPLWEGHNSRLLRGGELTTGAWLPVFWLSPVSPPHVEQRSERPVGPVGVDRVGLRHFWKKSPFLISLLTRPHFHSRGIPAFYVTRLFASKVPPGRSRVHSRKADRERERKKAKKIKKSLFAHIFILFIFRTGWSDRAPEWLWNYRRRAPRAGGRGRRLSAPRLSLLLRPPVEGGWR